MKFIETKYFLDQLDKLSSKYHRIHEDYEDLKATFNPTFSTNLWDECYKHRFKNSTIPTWQRWWFRFIIKVLWDKALPLLVYSKTMKTDITSEELKEPIRMVLTEIKKK